VKNECLGRSPFSLLPDESEGERAKKEKNFILFGQVSKFLTNADRSLLNESGVERSASGKRLVKD
jgi:hypothetical protein